MTKPKTAKTGRALGGIARANALSPEERTEAARNAAKARWAEDLPWAEYGASDRPLKIGEVEIPCYVLNDQRRVVTFTGVLTALGMAKGGKGFAEGKGDRLTRFVSGKAINPFIGNSLLEGIASPIRFRVRIAGAGARNAYGYEATILADLCEAILAARHDGSLMHHQQHIATQAETLVRGFARVGIIALVDEVTGFQRDRAQDALTKILEAFIAKELQPWVKTFPDEFYEQLFRLRGLSYPKDSVKRPQYFGRLTNNIIYRRLAPGVLEELKRSVPKLPSGRLKHPLQSKLTPELGHPKLRELLASVVTIMKLSDQYEDFDRKLDRIHPRYGETIDMDLDDNESGI